MPYLALTLIENLKLQLSPGLVASNYIQPGNEVGLFWDKHTHFYSLLQRNHTGRNSASVCKLLLTYGKSYSGFRLASKSVTLNDLESNGSYFALVQRIPYLWANYATVVTVRPIVSARKNIA